MVKSTTPPCQETGVDLFATRGVLRSTIAVEDIEVALEDHILLSRPQLDCGNCDDKDRDTKTSAWHDLGWVLSVHHSAEGDTKFWLITESDRGIVRVLLPKEY